MRPIRTIAIFPTLLTLGNLACGFFAVVIASRVGLPQRGIVDPSDLDNCMISAWLIFLAMVFDALDGYVARLSRTASDFGAELDSLCDVVTFGVAPAFLLVKMCPQFAVDYRDTIWIIATSYAMCAALRLARFNVETSDDDEHLHFSGLPSPAAAAAIAGFAILFHTLHKDEKPIAATQIDMVLQTILPFFAVLVALLMVSRVPYPHIVNQVFRGQRTFGHLVAVIFTLVAVFVVRGYSVAIVFSAFVLYGPIRLAWERTVHRRQAEEEESLF
ncbi:MAG: CDP-diacylglycerol--serine O-phosphatidyltransferase [Thermoguttaceae bacterium]|jgi:CDP-diacylglycerol--serine O-phosphatidyltransferase